MGVQCSYISLRVENRLLWKGSETWARRFSMGPFPVRAA